MGFRPFAPLVDTTVTAVSPSGDTTGAADAANINAAVSALPAAGGTVWLTDGQFYLKPGAVVINPAAAPVYLAGQGIGVTVINAVAGVAGDVIRMYNPTANNGGGLGGVFGGGVLGVTIDGTSATAGSAGLHIGDSEGMRLDVATQNFAGAGDIGVHIDNTIWWTEKLSGRIISWNNTNHVTFDMTGTGSSVQNSHGYTDLDIYIEAEANQNGVSFLNGANFYNGALRVRGNFESSSSAVTNAAILISGQAAHGVQNGAYSQVAFSRLDVQVESNGGLADTPSTVKFGTTSGPTDNAIIQCFGMMHFMSGGNSWTPSNAYGSNQFGTGVVTFAGQILGDTNLAPDGSYQGFQVAAPLIYPEAIASISAGTLSLVTQSGDFFQVTLSSSVTVSLTAFLGTIPSGPRRLTIVIQQAASGGPYTVTWPHAAAPSLTAPRVEWAGGTAPTMSSGASAVDVYELSTVDGATWYGRATQNVS